MIVQMKMQALDCHSLRPGSEFCLLIAEMTRDRFFHLKKWAVRLAAIWESRVGNKLSAASMSKRAPEEAAWQPLATLTSLAIRNK